MLPTIGDDMPAARKTLYELLVQDRSFLARRHAELLLSEPLVDDPVLRAAQERYRAEPSELERRQLALELEKAVRDPTAYARLAAALEAPRAIEPAAPLAVDEDLVRELERVLAPKPPVPISIAKDRRLVERYWRGMAAAKLADAGVPVHEIAAQLGVSVSTVRRNLKYLEQFRPRPRRRARAKSDRRR